jgi:hypothetical protein
VKSPFSPLILLIWIFFLFLVVSLGTYQFFIFSKNRFFVSLTLCIFSPFVNFYPDLYYFFQSAVLGFGLFFFSKSLWWIILLFICFVIHYAIHCLFKMLAVIAINFPLSTVFCLKDSAKLYFHFHLILGIFLFPPLFL